MSDNPYERDNPDEPVEPVTDDARPDGDPPGTEADAPSPEAGAPWAQRHDPAPPADDAPWLTGETARGTDDTTSPVPVASGPLTPDAGAHPADEDAGPDPAGPAHPADEETRPVPLAHDTGDAGSDATATDGDDPTGAADAERTQVLRTHQAERPVPRSGLAEHRSAAYLTGERAPQPDPGPETQDTTTTPAPWLTGAGATAAGATAAGAGNRGSTAGAERPVEEEPAPPSRPERDVVLEGTTAHTRPPSRAKAHVLTVLLTLLLTPVAWYLLADAGARLTLPQGNPWDTSNLNVAALLELAGGLLVLVVVLLAARWSSVGAIVTGALVIVVGVPFVAVPAWTQDLLEPAQSWLADLGQFGELGDNVSHHLVASGSTGRLVAVGVALVLVGVVSHGARRQGRREVRPAVEA